MAIPDWVQQAVAEGPAPLPGQTSWQPPPQTPEDAVIQAGFVPPQSEQVATVQAPIQAAEQPAQSAGQTQMMSVEQQAQPQVSELNYTPAPPPEAPATPVEQAQAQAQPDPYEQNMQAMLSSYLRPRRIPEAVMKAAETWQQSVPGAMPGQEKAYAAARQALEEQQNEALLDQRLQLQDQADLHDQDARNAYMQGRGYAAELEAINADQEQRKALVDQKVGELDRLIEQRSKLQSSFAERNPVRDMSMWTRISIGLGAAGQALAGGGNAALDIAMREIDADMARERGQIENLGLEIAAKRTLLGDMLTKFRDPVAADHAARAAKLGLYESGLRMQAAKEKSAEMRAAITNTANAVGLQREQEKLASLTGEHSTLMKWRPASVTGGGIAGLQKFAKDFSLTPEMQRQLMLSAARGDNAGVMKVISDAINGSGAVMSKDEVATARFNQEHKVQLPGGGIGYVKDKGDFEKTMTSLNKMDQNLGRLSKYVKSGSAWSPTDRANVESISNMAMGEIRVMLGLGVMSESDKELAKSLTGDFVNDRLSIADKEKRLEMLKSLTEQTRREYEKRITRDPNANTPAVEPIRSVRAE